MGRIYNFTIGNFDYIFHRGVQGTLSIQKLVWRCYAIYFRLRVKTSVNKFLPVPDPEEEHRGEAAAVEQAAAGHQDWAGEPHQQAICRYFVCKHVHLDGAFTR